jgi:hypothetical protein
VAADSALSNANSRRGIDDVPIKIGPAMPCLDEPHGDGGD